MVEGEKKEVKLMEHIFRLYEGFKEKYVIVSYCTNIYTLYNELFFDNDEDDLDLLQVLKSKESDIDKREILNDNYTDILLIFDLDSHDEGFADEKIIRMQSYFNESSDNGKLYLNYPMVEAFNHACGFPDKEFINRIVKKDELTNGTYKTRVNNESVANDLRKITKEHCNIIILQNLEKSLEILNSNSSISDKEWIFIDFIALLDKQLSCFDKDYLYILCTCVLYIYDYNFKLIY